MARPNKKARERRKRRSQEVAAAAEADATFRLNREHAIQRLRCLEISDSDSLSCSDNNDDNDNVHKPLMGYNIGLTSPNEGLRLEMRSHFKRTNACSNHMENRLKHIDEHLDFILNTIEEIKKDNQEIIASLRNISDAWLAAGSVARGYEQAEILRNQDIS